MPESRTKENCPELERELQHLLYVVSHDLGKYVRHMREFTLILLEESKDKFNPQELEYADMLLRAANLSENMILALLQYARVESEGKPFENTDSNALVAEVKENLQEVAAEKKANIIISPLPAIYADRKQFAQLWEQLLLNALTFSDPKRPVEIHIQAEEEGNRYIFSIKDNGIGMEEKHFEKIFKLFTRLHAEDSYPGTGAGLAIAKRIVRRHGGDIWVNSVPGRESTFFFSLPKH